MTDIFSMAKRWASEGVDILDKFEGIMGEVVDTQLVANGREFLKSWAKFLEKHGKEKQPATKSGEASGKDPPAEQGAD